MVKKLAMLSLLSAVLANPAGAEPASWTVSDGDSEVILYPTIHLLPDGLEWKGPQLEKDLARAEEIWLEVVEGPHHDILAQGLVAQYGIDLNQPLAQAVSPETYADAMAAFSALGQDPAAVAHMRPWLVSTVIAMMHLLQEGFDPQAGVEKAITLLADGRPLRGLETLEQQIRFMANMDPAVQEDMLRSTLDEADAGAAELMAMTLDWARGDVSALEEDLVGELKREMPALYETLIVKRNANWVEQIVQEMEGSGVDFIAVGAAHLLGEDSLPKMLRARGFEVQKR